jgi:hypothetical protein
MTFLLSRFCKYLHSGIKIKIIKIILILIILILIILILIIIILILILLYNQLHFFVLVAFAKPSKQVKAVFATKSYSSRETRKDRAAEKPPATGHFPSRHLLFLDIFVCLFVCLFVCIAASHRFDTGTWAMIMWSFF